MYACAAGAQAEVLSTQSTSEPEVVNGINESMRGGAGRGLREAGQEVGVRVERARSGPARARAPARSVRVIMLSEPLPVKLIWPSR